MSQEAKYSIELTERQLHVVLSAISAYALLPKTTAGQTSQMNRITRAIYSKMPKDGELS